MRFKNMLGLLAIGGAIAYAQKKRGGDFSLGGLKEMFNEAVGSVKSKWGAMNMGADGANPSAPVASAPMPAGDSGYDDNAYSSGFAGSDYSGRGGNFRH